MSVRTCLVLLVSLTFACGPKTRSIPGEAEVQAPVQARPAIEAQMPLLRWIPADAEMVLVAQSLAELEKLATVGAPILSELGIGGPELFAAPWLPGGIDWQGQVALFSRGQGITLLATEQDPSQLDGAWTRVGSQPGDPVAAHWGPPDDQAGERMRSAASGQGYSSLPVAEWALTGKPTVLRGHLPVAELLAAAVGGEQYLSCLPLLRAAQGIRLEAWPEGKGVRVRMQMQLSPSALEKVVALVGPGPSPGMRALRQTQAAHASMAVDLALAATALHQEQCPELAHYLEQAAGDMRWSPPPRAFHAAGTRLSTSDLSGSVALQVAQHDSRFVKRQLNIVPGRSFFESGIRVLGHKVKRLSVPTMSSVFYQLTNEQLLFATKKGLMESLLAGSQGPGPQGQEVGAAGLWPSRLPQLRRILGEVLPSRAEADRWTGLLQRFEYAGGSLRLEGSQLTLDVSLHPQS